MAVLNLPRPPSVNALFRNVPRVGRVKTRAYKDWLNEAGWQLRSQRPRPVQGKYRLMVLVGPTRADIDNLAKAVNDLLQTHGVVENDRLCDAIAMERSQEVPKGEIQCVVSEADTWTPLSDAVNNVLAGLVQRGQK